MSKRKGPSEENPNGGIVDFLMGMYTGTKTSESRLMFCYVHESCTCVCCTLYML